ncbi:hypothetical protein FYK55_12060 [Roseiconus nitratireducens]|uniref:Uncharacterized protein n=1 Tax=Roseiconus nitratireducens TaxID=2605748 RepID=A0A5M6D8S8_9BACT|nr:hypothetical protein [Roseiconus nitratireducens]KAA5543026.1 hypothetical protein FYK55_12060 [Roseiconus nitratireducens]
MISRLLALTLVFGFLSSPAWAASPSGRWAGSWSSASTGHRGPLRARVRQVDTNTYRTLFAGRFAKVIPFVYPATLHRVPGTCNQFESSARLPLMGEYRMTATVNGNQFYARFRSREDQGIFNLSR